MLRRDGCAIMFQITGGAGIFGNLSESSLLKIEGMHPLPDLRKEDGVLARATSHFKGGLESRRIKINLLGTKQMDMSLFKS